MASSNEVQAAATAAPSGITIKGILGLLMESIDDGDMRRLISLGIGDSPLPEVQRICTHCRPSLDQEVRRIPCLFCSDIVELCSDAGTGRRAAIWLYSYTMWNELWEDAFFIRAMAEYLSRDLPYKLTSDDVFLTSGCTQAIDASMTILSRPNANVLIPKPGFPVYDLVPEKGWEVNLQTVEALADENTVAMVVINPGNPWGNVHSYQHLKEIAETARRLKTVLIADEVYGHLSFGDTPFVPMGTFASIVPVLTLGSLSKRWIVPGWRLGWFVTTDPTGKFRNPKVIKHIKKHFDLLGGPATFIQAAVPRIIEETDEVFFEKTIDTLRKSSDICCSRLSEIPCLSCLQKPKGSMAMMVKLNLSMLQDISDDIDFCFNLAKEESVIVLPGIAVGLKNWVRITFATDPSSIEEAFRRVKSFCQRHSKQ